MKRLCDEAAVAVRADTGLDDAAKCRAARDVILHGRIKAWGREHGLAHWPRVRPAARPPCGLWLCLFLTRDALARALPPDLVREIQALFVAAPGSSLLHARQPSPLAPFVGHGRASVLHAAQCHNWAAIHECGGEREADCAVWFDVRCAAVFALWRSARGKLRICCAACRWCAAH